MSEITTDEKFDQLIKSNEALKEIATDFQNEIYIPINKQKDDNTNIVLNSIKIEIDKLQSKEFTIVIVGEVKAGKSTLINALIGYNLSHARNKAATTFPIRMTHVLHKSGVDFRFEPGDTFWQYAKKTANELKNITSQDQTIKLQEFKNTVAFIHNNNFVFDSFNQDNLEINQVRKLLECLHDFPRVYNIVFPDKIDDVMNISNLPSITLEFSPLKDLGQIANMGNIVLIDTPGIGEKGKKINRHISRLIKKEIAESSATMAVLKQGGTNSGNEALIQQFMEECKASSYIIASQMDQYKPGENDTSIKELISLIKNKFNKIHVEEVFPVAAEKALIGQMALDQLKKTNSLADPYDDPSIKDPKDHWTKELINDVHNRRAVKKYEEQAAGYKELLKETKDKQYQEVIKEEYTEKQDMSFERLKQEFQKIGKDSESLILSSAKVKIHKNLDIQSNSIKKAITFANSKVDILQDSISSITQLQNRSTHALMNMNNSISSIQLDIDHFIDSIQEQLDKAVSLFLNGDDTPEEQEIEEDIVEKTDLSYPSWLNIGAHVLNSILNVAKEIMVGKGIKAQLKEKDYPEVLELIQNFIDAQVDEVNQAINALSQNVNQRLINIPKEIVSINNELDENLKRKFNINTSTPQLDEVKASSLNIELDAKKYLEQKKHRYEKTGVWNTIKGWFGGDKYETVVYDALNVDKIYDALKQEIDTTTGKIIKDFEEDFQDNTAAITDYQEHLSKYMAAILNELQSNIDQRSSAADYMELLRNKMDDMLDDISNLQTMVQGIK